MLFIYFIQSHFAVLKSQKYQLLIYHMVIPRYVSVLYQVAEINYIYYNYSFIFFSFTVLKNL